MSAGNQVDVLTLSYDLNQLIHESAPILPNFFWCIDPIFINYSNFIMVSGAHASLHPNFLPSNSIFKIELKNG